jgi:glycosyltransferase involved in cell wall biosynthesis
MARGHYVYAIIPQTRESLQGTREGYTFPTNIEVLSHLETPPQRTIFEALPKRLRFALKYRWLRRSWDGPAYGTLLNNYHLIAKALNESKIEVIIFDHIETMHACAPLVKRLCPRAFRMLNAHNVDSELYGQQLRGASARDPNSPLAKAYAHARRIETHLADYVNAFWTCSEVDRDRLNRMNGGRLPGFAVPNGIALELLPFDTNPSKRTLRRLLFCGALNYPPNRRGLEWFHRAIWPYVRAKDPDIRLAVVGYGAGLPDFAELRADGSVDFIAEVDNVVPHYNQTSLSVVPLLEGSGTRVKILEAMSLGNPVVSTTVGAEGIARESGTQIVLADDPATFAEAILQIHASEEYYHHLRQAGRRLVEQNFDWRMLGAEINRIIDEIVCKEKVNGVPHFS